MWNSIDCGEKAKRGSLQGSSSVKCSIQALINNIKGKTWLKVDEMKSLYNAKPGRGERRGARGEISFSRQPGRQDIAGEHAAEETNNPSFINSRLKQKERERESERKDS